MTLTKIVRDKHRKLRLGSTLLALSLLVLAACGSRESDAERWEEDEGEVTENWAPGRVKGVKGVPLDSLSSGIERRLASDSRPAGLSESDWRRVRALYDSYSHVPLWLDEEGVRDRAEALLSALGNAHTDALRLTAYPIEELRRALAGVPDARRVSAERLVALDVLLTSTYVALGTDMFVGQIDPGSVSQGWHVDAREADVDSALARTLRMEPLDRGIARMRPQSDDFRALREALERYRDIVAEGGWRRVPDGEVLEPGDTSTVERLELLLSRLRVEGYADQDVQVAAIRDTSGASTGRAIYDPRLAGAIARFQDRHGIVVDSILGPNTLASLNTSAEYRLGQIAANMERYRWLPRSLGERYIFVNVPAFRLHAYDEGRPVLDMKVIVGAEYNDRATPAFSDSMSYVVFRPYWNIPENIALDEVLPEAASDPGYMRRKNYEVVRGWGDDAPVLGQYVPSREEIESAEVRIRERPGPANALGRVKFIFPNDFAIYLHDTPTEELFEQDVRAFSHGCIRVERPADLAQYVLGWDEARIRDAMFSGPESRRVDLDRKIPVYILYLTTYVQDGELHFGNDLYDRDDALVRAVADAAVSDSELIEAVEELEDRVD